MPMARLVLTVVFVCSMLPAGVHAAPAARPAGWLNAAVKKEAARLVRANAARVAVRDSAPSRSWIKRHPILAGAATGFAAGFLIGYLPGDDAVFDDFTASFNGMVIGGVGAGAGAVVGALFK